VRVLNKYIEADNESPPLINEILQKHEGVQYMISLDMRNKLLANTIRKEFQKIYRFYS